MRWRKVKANLCFSCLSIDPLLMSMKDALGNRAEWLMHLPAVVVMQPWASQGKSQTATSWAEEASSRSLLLQKAV